MNPQYVPNTPPTKCASIGNSLNSITDVTDNDVEIIHDNPIPTPEKIDNQSLRSAIAATLIVLK